MRDVIIDTNNAYFKSTVVKRTKNKKLAAFKEDLYDRLYGENYLNLGDFERKELLYMDKKTILKLEDTATFNFSSNNYKMAPNPTLQDDVFKSNQTNNFSLFLEYTENERIEYMKNLIIFDNLFDILNKEIKFYDYTNPNKKIKFNDYLQANKDKVMDRISEIMQIPRNNSKILDITNKIFEKMKFKRELIEQYNSHVDNPFEYEYQMQLEMIEYFSNKREEMKKQQKEFKIANSFMFKIVNKLKTHIK